MFHSAIITWQLHPGHNHCTLLSIDVWFQWEISYSYNTQIITLIEHSLAVLQYTDKNNVLYWTHPGKHMYESRVQNNGQPWSFSNQTCNIHI